MEFCRYSQSCADGVVVICRNSTFEKFTKHSSLLVCQFTCIIFELFVGLGFRQTRASVRIRIGIRIRDKVRVEVKLTVKVKVGFRVRVRLSVNAIERHR